VRADGNGDDATATETKIRTASTDAEIIARLVAQRKGSGTVDGAGSGRRARRSPWRAGVVRGVNLAVQAPCTVQSRKEST
jgi:hypothetical protein